MTYSSHRVTPTLMQLKKGFRIHFLVYLLCIPGTWLIWYLTDTSHPWPLYPTAVWGIGVLFHYLGVFVFKRSHTH